LFNAALVTPTYYVYFTSSTIVASAVLFRGFKGTPLSIATIIMGFLQICAGVVLLQLSKSAKDVPDTAVLNGDLDQIRTVGEQEQPESEPKADALRGAAALLRRISVTRQKMEAEEAKRVYEDKLRDQMEPIQEGEKVEWDGLRRRKTVLGQGSLNRTRTIHPPLGLTKFPSYEDELAAHENDRPPTADLKGGSLSSPRRRTGSSRISFAAPFSPRPVTRTDGSGAEPDNHLSQLGETVEMEHVYGLPPGLQAHNNSQNSLTPSHGKQIAWASESEQKPKRHVSLAPSNPRSPARRQFSFQNMFNRNKDGQRPIDDDHLKVSTEEERLGLTRGDSNNSSSDEEGSPVSRRVSTSAEALPLGNRSHGAPVTAPLSRDYSNSSPEIRTPKPGRSLPPLPTDQDSEDDDDFEKAKELESYRRPGYDGKGNGGSYA
jgi:magnesium transporter